MCSLTKLIVFFGLYISNWNLKIISLLWYCPYINLWRQSTEQKFCVRIIYQWSTTRLFFVLSELASHQTNRMVETDGLNVSDSASVREPANNTAHLSSAGYSQLRSESPQPVMAIKHPEYTARSARLGSYQTFPRHMKQHPADMTDAGFYYAGKCLPCWSGMIWKKREIFRFQDFFLRMNGAETVSVFCFRVWGLLQMFPLWNR